MRSELISTPAGSFDVFLAGREGGTAVILLHGFPETRDMWLPTMTELGAHDHFLIAPNQRGYGRSFSPRGKEHYDLDLLSADIESLARVRGLNRYVVVGHDWGAAVAWWLASGKAAGLAGIVAMSAPHPAVWRNAMKNDPEQRAQSRYVKFFGMPVLPELVVRLGRYKSLAKVIEPNSLSAEALAAYNEAWRRPGALTAMLNWYRAFLAREMPDIAILQIEVPVLLLHGSQDPFMTTTTARQSAALCTRCESHCVDGADHWLPRSAPQVINKHIAPFLSRVLAL